MSNTTDDVKSDESNEKNTVYECRVCGSIRLETRSLKQHWTVAHSDDVGEFPGSIVTTLDGGGER